MYSGRGAGLLVISAEGARDPHELAGLRAIRKSLNPASWNSLTKTSSRSKSMGASGEVCIFPQAKGSGSGLAICNPTGARSSASVPMREGLSSRMYSVPIRMGGTDRGINVGSEAGSAVMVAEVETPVFVAEAGAAVAGGAAGVAAWLPAKAAAVSPLQAGAG